MDVMRGIDIVNRKDGRIEERCSEYSELEEGVNVQDEG